MASPTALSANTQQAVLNSLPAQHEANKKSALKNALWTGVGMLGMVATAAIVPVALAPLASIVAATVTVYNGFKLLGNGSRALSLMQIKGGVKDENFVTKLKEKAGKALQKAPKLNNFANKAFYVVVGAVVASYIPVIAPIAALVYPVAMLGMLGAWGASEWQNGKAQATVPTAKLVYDHQVAEGAIRPAEDILPPGASVSRAPQQKQESLMDAFKRKAQAVIQQKKPQPKPAPKLAPPKP